jgi:hypothetical protein
MNQPQVYNQVQETIASYLEEHYNKECLFHFLYRIIYTPTILPYVHDNIM